MIKTECKPQSLYECLPVGSIFGGCIPVSWCSRNSGVTGSTSGGKRQADQWVKGTLECVHFSTVDSIVKTQPVDSMVKTQPVLMLKWRYRRCYKWKSLVILGLSWIQKYPKMILGSQPTFSLCHVCHLRAILVVYNSRSFLGSSTLNTIWWRAAWDLIPRVLFKDSRYTGWGGYPIFQSTLTGWLNTSGLEHTLPRMACRWGRGNVRFPLTSTGLIFAISSNDRWTMYLPKIHKFSALTHETESSAKKINKWRNV